MERRVRRIGTSTWSRRSERIVRGSWERWGGVESALSKNRGELHFIGKARETHPMSSWPLSPVPTGLRYPTSPCSSEREARQSAVAKIDFPHEVVGATMRCVRNDLESMVSQRSARGNGLTSNVERERLKGGVETVAILELRAPISTKLHRERDAQSTNNGAIDCAVNGTEYNVAQSNRNP